MSKKRGAVHLLSSLIFLHLFIQNFVLSASFDVVSIREVDEGGYHPILHRIYDDLLHFRIDRLIKLNDFSYISM